MHYRVIKEDLLTAVGQAAKDAVCSELKIDAEIFNTGKSDNIDYTRDEISDLKKMTAKLLKDARMTVTEIEQCTGIPRYFIINSHLKPV
jgi:lysozyme family protein